MKVIELIVSIVLVALLIYWLYRKHKKVKKVAKTVTLVKTRPSYEDLLQTDEWKEKEPQSLKETTDNADGVGAMIICKCTIDITADGRMKEWLTRGITRMKRSLRYAEIVIKRRMRRK